MPISNIRTVEVRRDSDNFKFASLTTPDEDELGRGHVVKLRVNFDEGGYEGILLSDKESRLLYEALDDWIYGA
jgi:hypothetical protein